jgi:hypothetical protein
MREPERPGGGDIRGPTHGDFTDWDNPEDELEEVPEGYYDEEGDGEFDLDPDDPDYDLSEGAGYAGWEAPRGGIGIPQWVLIALSLLLILAILLPALLQFD